MAGPREREFVGRANSYLLIIRKVVAEVVYLPRTINFLPGLESEDGTRARRRRRRGIVSRIFSVIPTGGFDGIAATLRCRVKTGDKSNDRNGLIDGEILS